MSLEQDFKAVEEQFKALQEESNTVKKEAYQAEIVPKLQAILAGFQGRGREGIHNTTRKKCLRLLAKCLVDLKLYEKAEVYLQAILADFKGQLQPRYDWRVYQQLLIVYERRHGLTKIPALVKEALEFSTEPSLIITAGRALQEAGHYDAKAGELNALTVFDRVQPDSDKYVGALIAKARCLEYMGQYDRAVEILVEREESRARIILAKLYRKMWQSDEALRILSEISDNPEADLTDRNEACLVKAQILLQLARYDEATDTCWLVAPTQETEKGQEHKPKWHEQVLNAQHLRIKILRTKGHLRTAEEQYRRYLHRHPDDSFVLVSFSQFLADQGRYDEALACLEQVENQDALIARVHCLDDLGQEKQATALLEAALLKYPRDIKLRIYYARRFERLPQQRHRAIELLTAYAEQFDQHPRFLLALAWSHIGTAQRSGEPRKTQHYETALSILVEQLIPSSYYYPEAHAVAAYVQAMLGRYADAEASYEAMCREFPHYWHGRLRYGLAYYEAGDYERAQQVYAHIVNQPHVFHRDAHLNYASCLAKRGNLDGAIAHLRKIVKEHPEFRLARRDLMRYLYQQGDYAAAYEVIDRAIAAFSDLPEMYQARIELMLHDPQEGLAGAQAYYDELVAHPWFAERPGFVKRFQEELSAHDRGLRLVSPVLLRKLMTVFAERGISHVLYGKAVRIMAGTRKLPANTTSVPLSLIVASDLAIIGQILEEHDVPVMMSSTKPNTISLVIGTLEGGFGLEISCVEAEQSQEQLLTVVSEAEAVSANRMAFCFTRTSSELHYGDKHVKQDTEQRIIRVTDREQMTNAAVLIECVDMVMYGYGFDEDTRAAFDANIGRLAAAPAGLLTPYLYHMLLPNPPFVLATLMELGVVGVLFPRAKTYADSCPDYLQWVYRQLQAIEPDQMHTLLQRFYALLILGEAANPPGVLDPDDDLFSAEKLDSLLASKLFIHESQRPVARDFALEYAPQLRQPGVNGAPDLDADFPALGVAPSRPSIPWGASSWGPSAREAEATGTEQRTWAAVAVANQ